MNHEEGNHWIITKNNDVHTRFNDETTWLSNKPEGN